MLQTPIPTAAALLLIAQSVTAQAPPPPPSNPRPPLQAPQYNLQLYKYNQVRSPHFPANTCGNRWLDLYNACPASGGIGQCGNWDTTVDEMVSCGLQDNSNSLPWKNHSHRRREQVVEAFCECISCAFLPAVRDLDTLVIPQQCGNDGEEQRPSLPSVVEQLAVELCDRAAPNSLDACYGFSWSAKSKCESGESTCAEFEITLGLESAEDFDEAAQLAFLGRLAGLANVPIDSLYVKALRAGSVVATVGVYSSYEDKVAAALVGSGGSDGGSVSTDDLSLALGAPVESAAAVPAGGGGGALSASSVLVPIFLIAAAAIVVWRWRKDRCAGLVEAKHKDVVVVGESQPPPPPPDEHAEQAEKV